MVINEYNKIQINVTEDRDPEGKLLKKSMMLNIRTNDPEEAVNLYNDLKGKLNGNGQKKELEKVPVKARSQKTEERVPVCPSHKLPMLLKENRMKGNLFWGCERWLPHNKGCNVTLPYGVVKESKEEVIELEAIPF